MNDKFQIRATAEIDSDFNKDCYETDVLAAVHAFSRDAVVVALQRTNEISVLVGNIASQTTIIGLNIAEPIERRAIYEIRIYEDPDGRLSIDLAPARHESVARVR